MMKVIRLITKPVLRNAIIFALVRENFERTYGISLKLEEII